MDSGGFAGAAEVSCDLPTRTSHCALLWEVRVIMLTVAGAAKAEDLARVFSQQVIKTPSCL